MRLTEQLEDRALHRTSAARKKLTRTRQKLFLRLKAKKLREMTELWTARQAFQDIERQIRGEDFNLAAQQEGADGVPSAPMSESQRRMYQALTAPLINDFDAQMRRRTEAIDALVMYCQEEEPLRPNLAKLRTPLPPPELDRICSPEEQVEELK